MARPKGSKSGRPDTSKMEKGEKFAYLANQRISKALGMLDNIKRLANARNYEFTQAQADRIRNTLADKANEVCDAFDNALKGGTNVKTAATFDINAKD